MQPAPDIREDEESFVLAAPGVSIEAFLRDAELREPITDPRVMSARNRAANRSQAYSSCAVSKNRKRGTRRAPGSQIHADDNEEAFTGTVARTRRV